MHIDLVPLSPDATYAPMTRALVPRPIARVTSRDEERGLELAPFSRFTTVSSDPPTILPSIGLHENGPPKGTRRNIEARHAFVVNIAHVKVDTPALDPIGRSGGGECLAGGEVFTIERPR